MGSGCLSPPAVIGQINLTLLDQIFQDIKSTTPQTHHSHNYQQTNPQMYKQIKQKIAKKGLLKKLCDYLSSHKAKIYETVLHCYRITNQSRLFYYKYIAIVVMDAILGSIPKAKFMYNGNGNVNGNYLNIGNANNQNKYFSVNSSYANNSFNQDQKYMIYNNNNNKNNNNTQNFVLSAVNSSTSTTRRKHHTQLSQTQQNPTPNNNNPYCSQINSFQFQNLYFTFINLLIKQDGYLYSLCLDNLIKYVSFSEAMFNNQAQVSEIMNIIYYHIETDNYLEQSVECYLRILGRVREGFFLTNLECLLGFFQIWLSTNNSNSVINSNQIQISIQSPSSQQKPNQPTPNNNNSNTLTNSTTRQIISTFIRKNIESYHYNDLIQIIFQVLDKDKFSNPNTNRVQQLLFESMEDVETKYQFNKTLVVFLMGYVAFPESSEIIISFLKTFLKQESYLSQNQNNGNIQQKFTNPLQRQWSQYFKLGNPQTFLKKYKNIQQRKTKMNSLPKISKWINQHKLVQLNQLLAYSGLNLLYSYILNLYSQEQCIKDKAVYELKNLIQKMKKNQRLVILNLIFTQLEDNQNIDDNIRFTLLAICESIVQRQKEIVIAVQGKYYINILQPINPTYHKQNNQKITKITGRILQKLSKQSIDLMIDRICFFLKSLYNLLVYSFCAIQHKIGIIERVGEFGDFGGCLEVQGVFVAFVEKNQREMRITNKQDRVPQNSYIYLDYLLIKLSKILNNNPNTQPTPTKNIQTPLTQSFISQIKQKQNKDIQQLFLIQQYSKSRTPLQPSSYQPYQNPPRQFQQAYSKAQQIFKNINTNINSTTNKQGEFNGTGSVFWKPGTSLLRPSSRDSNSINNSMHLSQGDQDLEDVLDIIKC